MLLKPFPTEQFWITDLVVRLADFGIACILSFQANFLQCNLLCSHHNIWKDPHVRSQTYRYYDAETKGLAFAGLMADAKRLRGLKIYTTLNWIAEQWQEMSELFKLDLGTSGHGGIWPYVGTCIFVGGFGLADACVQGGMLGDISYMDPHFIQAFSAGLASSGVVTSGLRFITKASFNKASNGLQKGFCSMAGVNSGNVEYLAKAIHEVPTFVEVPPEPKLDAYGRY